MRWAPDPIKNFQRKILLYAGIDKSQSLRNDHVTDLIGQFQLRVKFYAEISIQDRAVLKDLGHSFTGIFFWLCQNPIS